MKYYVVGFLKPTFGDALVRAETSSEALSRMRRAGYTPNPGERYLLPASGQFPEDHFMSDANEYLIGIREAPVEDITILWRQEK